MKTYLVIDVSYLIYRAYFAYPDLTAKVENEQIPIGAFFGFVKTILALCQHYDPNELIFACDTSSPTWRHDIQTDYKAGRKPLEDAMRSQIPLIQNWCQSVSPHFLMQKGLEADDLIASAVINLQNNLKTEQLDNFFDFRGLYSHDNSHQDFYNLSNFEDILEKMRNPENQKIENFVQKINLKQNLKTNLEQSKNINLEILKDKSEVKNSPIQDLGNKDQNGNQNEDLNLKKIVNSENSQNNPNLQKPENWESDAEKKARNNAKNLQKNLSINLKNLTEINLESSKNDLENERSVENLADSSQKTPENKILIFSKDRDLFQLLVFENVFFVDMNKGISEIFGQSNFVKKYNLNPREWLCYKTLVGDSGDNLAGIPGIGSKTATDILQIFGSVENFLNYEHTEMKTENKINLAKTKKIVGQNVGNFGNEILKNEKSLENLGNLKDQSEQNENLNSAQNCTQSQFQNQNSVPNSISDSMNLVQKKSAQNFSFSKEIQIKVEKLVKWQKLIKTDQITQIRRLSSLCWIDLGLNNSHQISQIFKNPTPKPEENENQISKNNLEISQKILTNNQQNWQENSSMSIQTQLKTQPKMQIETDENTKKTLSKNNSKIKENLESKTFKKVENIPKNSRIDSQRCNFNLTNGIDEMTKYGFKSLITTLNNFQKRNKLDTQNFEKSPKSQNMDSLF